MADYIAIIPVIWPLSMRTTMPREMPNTIMTPTCVAADAICIMVWVTALGKEHAAYTV